MGRFSWSMNQDIQSLLTDWGGLKHFRMTAVRRPKMTARAAEMRRLRNWKPPCWPGLVVREGVRLFLPAVKMASKIPPRVAKMMG